MLQQPGGEEAKLQMISAANWAQKQAWLREQSVSAKDPLEPGRKALLDKPPIDRDDETIRSWLSFASNNVEDCSGSGLVEAAVASS